MKHKLQNGRDITLEEVSRHNSYVDGWCVLYDKVYNVSSFVIAFPDGRELLECAGGEGTQKFGKVFA